MIMEKHGKPTRRYIENVIRLGLPDQIAALSAILASFGDDIKNYSTSAAPTPTDNSEPTPALIQYKKLFSKSPDKGVDPAQDLARFIKASSNTTKTGRPPFLDYQFVRRLVWQAFKTIVSTSAKLFPDDITIDKEQAESLKNATHYIIGSNEGAWDPDKSLLFYSSLGVGKSTIAEVVWKVSDFIARRYEWSSRKFDFVSLNEIFVSSYTTQSLGKIGQLSTGNWVIDELKEDHIKYKHFGNDLPILDDIIEVRYTLWCRHRLQTIITTNLGPADIKNLFDKGKFEDGDSRIFSRITQQYQAVHLKGENKRHPKYRLKTK